MKKEELYLNDFIFLFEHGPGQWTLASVIQSICVSSVLD